MDDRLSKALDFANYRQTLAVQRKTLKEKIDARLTIGYNGGLFKIDRSLISFVEILINKGRTKNVPLLDKNENPILEIEIRTIIFLIFVCRNLIK